MELQNIKIELEALKSKCQQLQSTSPYSMQFDAYENETRLQLHQIQNLKELNAALTAQLADSDVPHKGPLKSSLLLHSPQKFDSCVKDGELLKRPVNKKPSASMKKLEKEIASLQKQNLELQSKARCYDFFRFLDFALGGMSHIVLCGDRKQSSLLMAEVRSLKSRHQRVSS